jgi:hypothetical protein
VARLVSPGKHADITISQREEAPPPGPGLSCCFCRTQIAAGFVNAWAAGLIWWAETCSTSGSVPPKADGIHRVAQGHENNTAVARAGQGAACAKYAIGTVRNSRLHRMSHDADSEHVRRQSQACHPDPGMMVGGVHRWLVRAKYAGGSSQVIERNASYQPI